MTVQTGVAVFAAFLVASVATPMAQANDAGCGLGNLVMPRNSKLSQSLAVTTNGTFSSQLFGITSGTSGCSSSQFAENDQKAEVFAEANFPNLQVEMARGQGENLSAFARLLGCNDGAIPAFAQLTRARFDKIYPTDETTPTQMLRSVRRAIDEDSTLAAGCTVGS